MALADASVIQAELPWYKTRDWYVTGKGYAINRYVHLDPVAAGEPPIEASPDKVSISVKCQGNQTRFIWPCGCWVLFKGSKPSLIKAELDPAEDFPIWALAKRRGWSWVSEYACGQKDPVDHGGPETRRYRERDDDADLGPVENPEELWAEATRNGGTDFYTVDCMVSEEDG